MINSERLWNRLMGLVDVGVVPDGGVTRLSFTPEEREAKDRVAKWMREAGLTVREDAVGNLIGRLEGQAPDAPVVLCGSHVDSVVQGGNFDGPLGVLAGLEAVQTMLERGERPYHPIEVIAFTDEEGARFGFGMIGSRGIAGTLTSEELQATDQSGISIAAAMEEANFNPARFRDAVRAKGSVKAYLELHIEQGKVLETAGVPVGVVTGIAGPLWLRVQVSGRAGHAGATPMNMRSDALVAAAEMILAAEMRAAQRPVTVATVGKLSLLPGGINIIPGTVEFTVDLRDIEETARDEAEQAFLKDVSAIAERRGVQAEVTDLQRVNPVKCDAGVQDAILRSCSELGLSAPLLMSGAGHDGMQLSDLCPIGMLFVRSKDGVSHNPAEFTTQEDCAAGANVLYKTLLRVAAKDS